MTIEFAVFAGARTLVISTNSVPSSTPAMLCCSRGKACEQRTNLPDPFLSPLPFDILTPHQVWGVTEEYFKKSVFPDASDSLLSTLGSMSGMVS